MKNRDWLWQMAHNFITFLFLTILYSVFRFSFHLIWAIKLFICHIYITSATAAVAVRVCLNLILYF